MFDPPTPPEEPASYTQTEQDQADEEAFLASLNTPDPDDK